MTPHVYNFVKNVYEHFKPYEMSVLEVGSQNINGQVRDIFEEEGNPYLGIDMVDGPGVDRVVNVLDLTSVFGEEKFNIVVCCDTLEHIDHFWIALHEMKAILTPGGLFIVTVPDFGVKVHRHPQDYWRFGEDSLHLLMADLTIVHQENITDGWGVVGQKAS